MYCYYYTADRLLLKLPISEHEEILTFLSFKQGYIRIKT